MSKKNFSHYRPHPWHGIPIGSDAPKVVKGYIEILPNDPIKYEICKETGFIMVDRPQKFSSLPPVLYGLIPQTYSAEQTASFSALAHNGDGDPLDLCVLSDLPITARDVIMDVRVIGGIRLIDSGEVDDKIIAVLDGDPYYKNVNDIKDVNEVILNRMKHYFLSYKTIPGEPIKMQIETVYGREEAYKVIDASRQDYKKYFE